VRLVQAPELRPLPAVVDCNELTCYLSFRAWTTYLPLIIVLGVSMVKEGIEDWKRYKQDKEVNSRKVG
jgi:hypothetical protein